MSLLIIQHTCTAYTPDLQWKYEKLTKQHEILALAACATTIVVLISCIIVLIIGFEREAFVGSLLAGVSLSNPVQIADDSQGSEQRRRWH